MVACPSSSAETGAEQQEVGPDREPGVAIILLLLACEEHGDVDNILNQYL